MGFCISLHSILAITTVSLFAGLTAFAQSPSYELTCRNKAKEIAAETYKNCVTEHRQSQIEQIRKDYKEKMAELKNHYDNELKKISSDQQQVPATANSNNSKITSQKPSKKTTKPAAKMRSSGARSLPEKTVKTQVIDLTAPAASSDEFSQPSSFSHTSDEGAIQSQNSLISEAPEDEGLQDSEIVELPIQE